MIKKTILLALICLLLPIFSTSAQSENSVYLKTHRIHVTIENQVATTRIEQVFYNDSDRPAEGTYIFPLPKGASVSDLVMYVDGKAIQARILDADEARETYEEIVRTLRDPALLEYIGQDAIQASIFPIQARSEVKIEIEYTSVLLVENGLVRYVYPLRTDQFSRFPVDNMSISVDVKSNDKIGSVYSPTHPIAVSREGDYTFRAGYESRNSKEANNFNLYYSLANEDIDLNLLTYRESAREDGFFLLLLAPPVTADDAQILPRDVIIVLDQSGSMFGDKWEQAREAAKYVLDHLNPEDRFNVVAFSTGTRVYANSLQNPAEAEGAKRWLNSLEAIGGTEIDAALKEAFLMSQGERPAVILFLTDGLPTEGETNAEKILEEARATAPQNARIFTFGVGDDVDTFLLDSLAQSFGGVGAYVRPNERIDEEVEALYSKVSSPVMTNISLDFGNLRVEDMYPDKPLPDLFIGSQLIVTGRYRGDGETDITLKGEVNGETRTIVYDKLLFPANAGGEGAIPRLWATRKIGALLNSIRLNGENSELVESIVRLSTRYGIITPYTSFFIDETDIFTQAGRDEANRQAASNMNNVANDRTGSGAVGAADSMNQLEAAEVAQAPSSGIFPAPTQGANSSASVVTLDDDAEGRFRGDASLRVLNDRSFLLREEVWIDTAYDASNMILNKITFLSDEYFDLLDKYPEIGLYFTLGDNLILVIDNEAFEIKPD